VVRKIALAIGCSGAISYTRERAERCLKSAKSIINWVKEVADP